MPADLQRGRINLPHSLPFHKYAINPLRTIDLQLDFRRLRRLPLIVKIATRPAFVTSAVVAGVGHERVLVASFLKDLHLYYLFQVVGVECVSESFTTSLKRS